MFILNVDHEITLKILSAKDKSHQGKGIMTRVVKALIDYAFDQLALNRVEILVAFNNIKSRAIPERLGLKKEGYLRQAEWLHDHYVDLMIYAVLKKDWS